MRTRLRTALRYPLLAGGLALSVLVQGCGEPASQVRPAEGRRALFLANPESTNVPGPASRIVEIPNPFEGNVVAIAKGRRLYAWFNCYGCHGGRGGGGQSGPPHMDRIWRYGGTPGNIYVSITAGRPNGMPAWGGRIPEYQIWELVAYLRALSTSPSGPVLPRHRQAAAEFHVP